MKLEAPNSMSMAVRRARTWSPMRAVGLSRSTLVNSKTYSFASVNTHDTWGCQSRICSLSAPNAPQDRAIGRILSCYSRRNGTPRQPALVTGARAELRLRRQARACSLCARSGRSCLPLCTSGCEGERVGQHRLWTRHLTFPCFCCAQLPLESLEGLDQFSHCWVIYVFHQNTNLHNEEKARQP